MSEDKADCGCNQPRLKIDGVLVETDFSVRAGGDWDESEHPRDPDGKFGFGGGGGGSAKPSGGKGGDGDKGKEKGKDKGKHPGKGYTKDAYEDDKGVIHTPHCKTPRAHSMKAARSSLTSRARYRCCWTKLGEIAKRMIDKPAEKAPNFNLCNVSVSGTNLFCVGNKEIRRIEMPQLDDQADR